MVPAPRRLRVEHLEEALGIDVVAPRLSWQLAAPATRQEAYRLEVGDWSSGWVESDDVRPRALRRARRSDRAPGSSGACRCAPTPALSAWSRVVVVGDRSPRDRRLVGAVDLAGRGRSVAGRG